MNISLVGVNYSTTPVSMREKVAITEEKLDEHLQLLRSYIPDGVILSTCNRTEIYTTSGQSAIDETIVNYLNTVTGVSFVDLLPHIYLRKNKTAFRHLFRIASGLDSMIIGEYEVLGQIRNALTAAENADMVTAPMRHIFHSALRTGRQVRDETGISRSALSVSSVAVDLAEEVVDSLGSSKMLVIGAGEAGGLVAKVARERGVSRIVIANRTEERAAALAISLGGTHTGLNNLPDELSSADIVVACTGAADRILEPGHVEQAIKNRPDSPLVIIDIGVPRNVDPEIKNIENVFLYNIDDMTEISEKNRQQRKGEIEKAESIMTAELDRCLSEWAAFDTRPIISALMQKAEAIRNQQLSKTLKKLPPLSEEEQFNLEAMTKSIVTKILQDPIQYLKKNKNNGEFSGMVNELFRLDSPKSNE
ncbi:MAG: glutamyl-tRNA reductase [Dehalococcoidales bacterium]